MNPPLFVVVFDWFEISKNNYMIFMDIVKYSGIGTECGVEGCGPDQPDE